LVLNPEDLALHDDLLVFERVPATMLTCWTLSGFCGPDYIRQPATRIQAPCGARASMIAHCLICDLELKTIDRINGRVVEYQAGEAHAYCRLIRANVVPNCPLADQVTPRPCTDHCLQAKICTGAPECACCCDSLACRIGQAVRALRARGEVRWHGHAPKSVGS